MSNRRSERHQEFTEWFGGPFDPEVPGRGPVFPAIRQAAPSRPAVGPGYDSAHPGAGAHRLRALQPGWRRHADRGRCELVYPSWDAIQGEKDRSGPDCLASLEDPGREWARRAALSRYLEDGLAKMRRRRRGPSRGCQLMCRCLALGGGIDHQHRLAPRRDISSGVTAKGSVVAGAEDPHLGSCRPEPGATEIRLRADILLTRRASEMCK